MSSELERQLAGHRAKYVLPTSLSQGKASLFLSLKEAAGVDVEVVHEAAVKHATILAQYDPRFSGFLDTILHESSVSYQRELKTSQENKVLDKQLDDLMELLSVFALEPSAHLVLEYLIRRYAVQEYNVHSLIRCFLHVHDSKIFARIIQLCNLVAKSNTSTSVGGKETMWTFLSDVKTTGVPLLRSTLIQKLTNHSATNNDHSLLILQAICDSVHKCKKLQSVGEVSDLFHQGLINKISWFTCVILELTPAVNPRAYLTDQQLRIVYPVLDDSFDELLLVDADSERRFRYPNLLQQESWKMSVVLLSHVSSRTAFAPPLLQAVVGKLLVILRCLFEADPSSTDSEIDGYATDVIGVLSVLANTQKLTIKWSALMSLAGTDCTAVDFSIDNILRMFGSIRRLLAGSAGEALVKALTLCLLAKWKSTLAADDEDDEESSGKSRGKAKGKESAARKLQLQNISLVGQLLSNSLGIQLLSSEALLRYVLLFLYSVNNPHVPPGSLSTASVAVTTTLMKQIAQRHDGVFTTSINSHLNELRAEAETDPARRERFESLLRDVFCDNLSAQPQALEGGDEAQEAMLGSLFVALKSDISVVRGQAVRRFVECYPLPVRAGGSAGSPGVLSAVIELFADGDAGFATQLWEQAPDVLCRVHAYSGVNDNDTVSPSDMLDAVRMAWDHWIAAVPLHPSDQGGDILLAVTQALSTPEVLEILVVEDAHTVGVSAQCWMLMACVRLAHGVVPTSLVKAASHRELAEKLADSSITLCAQLGGAGAKKPVYVDILKPAGKGRSGTQNGAVSALAACLTSNLVGMSGSQNEQLSAFTAAMQCAHRFASWAHDSAQLSHHGWGYVDSLLLVLEECVRSVHEMLDAKKPAAGTVSALEFLLTNQLPLLLSLRTSFAARHAADVASPTAQSLLEALDRSIGFCQHGSLAAPLFSVVGEEVLSAQSMGGRVLVELLTHSGGSGTGGRTAILALKTFFGGSEASMFAVLKAIAFCPIVGDRVQRAVEVASSDSQLIVPSGVKVTGVWSAVSSEMTAPLTAEHTVEVASDARVGALLTLSALLHSTMSTGSVDATELATLVPLVLTACVDADSTVRAAATAVCATVVSCGDSVDSSFEVVSGTKKTKGADATKVLFADVARLLAALTENTDEVVLGGRGAEHLQALLLDSDNTSSNQRLCTWFVDLCARSTTKLHPHTASLLLRSVCSSEATNAGFDMSALWGCVHTLLKESSATGDDEADAKLRATLVWSFECFFAASGKGAEAIHEAILSWTMGSIAAARSHVIRTGCGADADSTLLWCNELLAAMESPGWCAYSLISGHKAERKLYKDLVELYLHGARYNEVTAGVQLMYTRKLIVSTLKQLWRVDLEFVCTEALEPTLRALMNAATEAEGGSLVIEMQHACNSLELLADCVDSPELLDRLLDNTMPSGQGAQLSAFVKLLGELLQCCVTKRTTRFRSLPSTEYCVSLALELLCKALDSSLRKNIALLAGSEAPTNKSKKSKSAANTPAKAAASTGDLLSAAYMQAFITSVLNSIYECGLLSVKTAGLQCLVMAIRLSATVGDDTSRAHTVDSCVRTLSRLLAGSTLALTSSQAVVAAKPWNHTIISQILAALLSVSSVGGGAADASASYAVMYNILSGYCAHFAAMQASQRYWYLQLCVDALNSNCRSAPVQGQEQYVLPAATAVLLSQAFLQQMEGADMNGDEEGDGVGLILLSRNAAKNHRQSLVTSKSEELFQLAVDLSSPSADALSAMKASGLLGTDKLDNVVTVSESCVGMLKFVSSGQSVGSIGKICVTAAGLFSAESGACQPQGACALLLLLHLEYLQEVLENRSFHRYVGTLKLQASESEAGGSAVQTLFLHLFEHLLELFTLSSQLQTDCSSDGVATVEVPMRGGSDGSVVAVPLKSFLVTVKAWCCKIIKAMQKLLDMPVFIAILLELLSGDAGAGNGEASAQLQEQAIVILTDRLDYLMSSTSSSSRIMVKEAEKALLLDLYAQLKTIIFDGLGTVLKPTASKSRGKQSTAKETSTSFLQSAVMCLDILTRYLGTDSAGANVPTTAGGGQKWSAMFLDTLVQFMPFTSQVTDSIVSSTAPSEAVLKVAGSLFLCTSTLVSSVVERRGGNSTRSASNSGGGAAKVLPHLAAIMTQYHTTFMHLQSQCATSVLGSTSPTDVNITPECLVLRSLLAAFGVLFQSISAYLHVHMHAVLRAILTAYQNFNLMLIRCGEQPVPSQAASVELSAILCDIQSLVATVLSTVSPRLACPVLVQYLAPKEQDAYVHLGDHAMQLLVYVLGTGGGGLKLGILECSDCDADSEAMEVAGAPQVVVEGIFRTKYHRAVVQENMAALCQIALLLLDYRRSGAGDTAGALDGEICRCVVELCLKWTETELSNFVSRALVWKNSEVSVSVGTSGKKLKLTNADAEDSEVSSDRAVVFFHLLSALSHKLQGIFTPTLVSGATMAWSEAVHALQGVCDACEEDGESAVQLMASSKKRKASERAPLPTEVAELCKYTLLCVRGVATHHLDCTAIDTVKYESVMPLLVSLLPHWGLFSAVATDEVLVSTLTALAKAVNKDLLWKPMNYKLLMLTRPSRTVGRGKLTSSTTNYTPTRLLAIRTLHQLFIDVGEDYLMLLPECLPFLSECLEDHNKDIVHYTSKFIQYIETLSGEKLDAYLV
mgnify:CR=1 FL=1